MGRISSVEIKLYSIVDFIAQLKSHGMGQVFRSRTSSAEVKYSVWCPESSTFLTFAGYIPQLTKLAEVFSQLTMYQSDPFRYNDQYFWAKTRSKTKFVKMLKALGAKQSTLKKFDKVTVSELRRVIDKSSPDEEVITVTRNTKVHECRALIAWCGHEEAVCQMSRSGNGVEYVIILEGWGKTRSALIKSEESAFHSADITVIEGEVSIVDRY